MNTLRPAHSHSPGGCWDWYGACLNDCVLVASCSESNAISFIKTIIMGNSCIIKAAHINILRCVHCDLLPTAATQIECHLYSPETVPTVCLVRSTVCWYFLVGVCWGIRINKHCSHFVCCDKKDTINQSTLHTIIRRQNRPV